MAGKLTATATTPQPRNVPARGQGALVSAAYAKYAKAAALPGHGAITAAAFKRLAATASPSGHGSLIVPTTKQIYNITSGQNGHGALGGSGFPKFASAAALPGQGIVGANAVPVVQFDTTAFPNAYGYGSSFTMTPASVGAGMFVLPVLTYGSGDYALNAKYGAIPAQGGSQAQMSILYQLELGSNQGWLTIFYGAGSWNGTAVTCNLNTTTYYSAIGLIYLNANNITLGQTAASYASNANIIINSLQSSPTYTGVNVWGLYSGGSASMLSGEAVQPVSRGVQTEGNLSLGVQDIGPQTTTTYAGYSCTQGAYYGILSMLLHA